MATNTLGKQNLIIWGQNYPPTNWDDPHPYNKCSGPQYSVYTPK